MTAPYRGVAGARRREPDEGRRRPTEYPARYASTCAETGAAIRPGDLIQRDRLGRTVLVRRGPR